jgi:polyisoprenoid-binding protein YceI
MRVAVALAWVATSLASVTSSASEVVGRCQAVFTATSTLHDFSGQAPCSLLEVEAGDVGTYRARAEVTVQQLDTGIAGRDEKMREMFDAGHHPKITATFAKVDPEALRAQRANALPFRIAIRGVERDVVPRISNWSEVPGQRAHFRASFDLSLKEFGLEAPVAMGFMRVDDRVRVDVDVEVETPKVATR